jgi:hypothetical protein
MTNEKAKPTSYRASKKAHRGHKAGELVYGFRDCPLPKAVIEKWIQDLKNYEQETPPHKSMIRFVHSRGYTEQLFYDKLKEYPELKKQYDMTKEAIGERLWGDCVDGKKNWHAAKFMIHDYSPRFAAAKEMEKPQQQTGVIERFVVLPAIPTPKDSNEDIT